MLYLVTKTVEAYVMADDEMDLDDEGCDVEVNAIPANTALIPNRWLGALPFSEDEKEQRTIRQIIAQDDMEPPSDDAAIQMTGAPRLPGMEALR